MNFMSVQYLIKLSRTKKIALSEVDKMYGLGTPEDLKFFEKKLSLKNNIIYVY